MKRETRTDNNGEWVLTEYYCPYCGAPSMWQRTKWSDYYAGTTTKCNVCERETHLLDVVAVEVKQPWWDSDEQTP